MNYTAEQLTDILFLEIEHQMSNTDTFFYQGAKNFVHCVTTIQRALLPNTGVATLYEFLDLTVLAEICDSILAVASDMASKNTTLFYVIADSMTQILQNDRKTYDSVVQEAKYFQEEFRRPQIAIILQSHSNVCKRVIENLITTNSHNHGEERFV